MPIPFFDESGSMAWFTTLETFFTAAAAAVGSIAATVFALRRKYSADTNEIHKDKTETSLMRTLMTERDAAMKAAQEAWLTRTEDAKQIIRLETRLEAEVERQKEMREELLALRIRTMQLLAIAAKADPVALDMIESADDKHQRDEPS